MRWFQGSIPQAIEKSRSTGAYFVVYIRGPENDSKSEEFSKLLRAPSLSSLLDSEKFLKIQLLLGSTECTQFSQIYPVIVVPSMYFIDQQGTPVEVVGGNVSADTFLERIQKLPGVAGLEQQGESEPVVIPPVSEETPKVAEDVKPLEEGREPLPEPPKDATVGQSETVTAAETLEEVSEPAANMEEEALSIGESEGASPTSPEAPQLTLEEKLEKARQLTEAIRIKKEKEEKEKERRQEIERRETLKSLQKFKQEQEEREMKELAEQRRKEKEADRLAREKVKRQIEQDRLEKAAKFNAARNEAAQKEEGAKKLAEQQAVKAASDAAAARSETARIQFRFPDGSAIVETFPATSTFAEVRKFVEGRQNLPFRNFRLTTTLPRREFGAEDSTKTLRALELAPSAAILVVPSDSLVQSRGGAGVLSSVVQMVLGPFFTILGYIRLFIFGTPTTQRSESASPPAKKPKSDSQSPPTGKAGSPTGEAGDPSGSVRRRNLGANAAIKREGNIHRFVDRPDDDDDENNTWNGNSTQQM